MKKMTVLCLVLSLFVFSCTETFAASGSKKGFSAAELKRMSTFLSNFTELGFMDFERSPHKRRRPRRHDPFGIGH